jgi:hypothetical protein
LLPQDAAGNKNAQIDKQYLAFKAKRRMSCSQVESFM